MTQLRTNFPMPGIIKEQSVIGPTVHVLEKALDRRDRDRVSHQRGSKPEAAGMVLERRSQGPFKLETSTVTESPRFESESATRSA